MMLMSQVCLIIKISGNVQKDYISIAQQSIHSLTPPPPPPAPPLPKLQMGGMKISKY